MRNLLLMVAFALVVCEAQPSIAADRNIGTSVHRQTLGAYESFPGPDWYYRKPLPFGAYVTTVTDSTGRRCYSRLLQAASGWLIPHSHCEYPITRGW